MIGEVLSTGLCRPCGSGNTWGPGDCRDYFGREYSYIGENSCNYDCKVAGVSPGTSARCQKTSYGGLKKDCCLDGKSRSGSCDPNFNTSSPSCDEVFIQHCSTGNNIITDDRCIRWQNSRNHIAFPIMKKYCESNPGISECVTWCRNNSGVCDDVYTRWCVNNDNLLCACINSPLQKIGANPRCNDKLCINHGIITKNMIDSKCPSVIDCSIQVPMKNSGAQLVNINIDQKCSDNSVNSAIQSTSNITQDTNMDDMFIFFGILLILLFVLFISLVIYYVYKIEFAVY